MTTPSPAADLGPHQQMQTLELGDVVQMSDGRSLTVRAVERSLAVPVGDMAGFVLAGEIGPQSTLLSISANPAAPVLVYTPIDHIPEYARTAQAVCEGVVSYWAPHVPGLSGAHGELGYKVCRVRGSVDPMVLLWRNAERVVFIKTATFTAADLRFLTLRRDAAATEVDQTRYAARVGLGAQVSEPARADTRERVLDRLRRRR